MAKRVIYAGVTTNDGKGDTLKVGAQKINDNFTELYTALGADTGSLSVVSGLVAGDGITVSSPAGQVTVTSKIATDVVLGGVKIGDNLNITEDGVLSANPGNYSLPVATGGTLGGVKVTGNDGIAISGTGVISVTPYSLPTATSTVLGAIKVGARLAITDGVLSATDQSYTLPKATDFSLGGVIVDGSTIAINSNGVISVLAGGGTGTIDRLVNGDNEVVLEADGSISLPTKTTTSYNGGTNTAPTLTLGTLGSNTIITQPETDSVNTGDYAIRIQGQRGYGTWGNTTADAGWGGSIQIYGGQGGETGGDLSLVRGGEGGYVDIQGGVGQAGRDGGDVYLKAGDTQSSIGYTSAVNGGDVYIQAGNATSSIEPGFGQGGNVTIIAGVGNTNTTNGDIQFNTSNGFWSFKSDGSFSINGNEVSVATNNWGISVGGGIGATGVVYTAKQNNLASIRVHATIEGIEDGDATGLHTQACDIMIVRRVAIGGAVTVDAVVYGVIYTGAAPLATLDAQWNPGTGGETGRIEITATPTSATENVYVKVYATEVARGD